MLHLSCSSLCCSVQMLFGKEGKKSGKQTLAKNKKSFIDGFFNQIIKRPLSVSGREVKASQVCSTAETGSVETGEQRTWPESAQCKQYYNESVSLYWYYIFMSESRAHSWVQAQPDTMSTTRQRNCQVTGPVTFTVQWMSHGSCFLSIMFTQCVCGCCSHGFRQDSDQQSCSRETAWRFERIKSHVSIREPHWQQSRMLQRSPDIQPVSGSTQNSLSHRVHEPTATDCLIKLIWSACATFLALKYSVSVIL